MKRTSFSSMLPTRKRGRPTEQEKMLKEQHLEYFAKKILEMQSTLDFKISARGWCYLLEGKGIITKGDFNKAEQDINTCRKSGLLPMDICAEDMKRSTDNILYRSESDIKDHFDSLRDDITSYIVNSFQPVLPTDYQSSYIEMAVERIDLIGLFSPVCDKYGVPITNMGGWGDLNSRSNMLKRFDRVAGDKTMILLYCGDHDPGGLNISESLRRNLKDLEKGAGCVGLTDYIEIVRFGLNYDFIEANNLAWIDNLETSSGGDLSHKSHKDHNKPYVQTYIHQYGARKCEANALVVNVTAGRKLCETAILQYIDSGKHNEYSAALNRERMKLNEYISNLF